MKTLLTALALCFVTSLVTPVQARSMDWSLSNTKGGKFKLSENLGHPILLVFWATWCVPCKKEIDDLRSTFEDYEEHGTRIILVSEDTQKSQAKVQPYVASKGYTWIVLLDPDGELLKRYGGTSVPYSVLLDRAGEPKLKNRGAIRDVKSLTAAVNGLLGSDDK